MNQSEHSENATRTLPLAARVWNLTLPIRWPVSLLLWCLSRILWGVSLAFWYVQAGIDFLRLLFLDYRPRPDDVFIVTYPRSGTTWMQMIMYQLTTDGEMNFAHIGDVCPLFERVAVNKRNLEKFPSPRIFKSHLPLLWMPRRAPRCIYVARDGKDVAVSFYHFMKSHFKYRGSFSSFFKLFMIGCVPWGSWFFHVRGWWKRRRHPNVLFLQYDELVADLEGTLRRIIEFCNLEVDEERFPEIVERCSFSYMKEHEQKFDFAAEHMLELGYTPKQFLRKGKSGDWESQFSEEEAERFNRKFEKRLGALGIDFDE